MANVTEVYRRGTQWFRVEDVRATGDKCGCTGCFFFEEADRGTPRCVTRPCVASRRADKREVIFRLIPEATSKRLRVSPDGNLFITHRFSGLLWKVIKYTRIVNIT